MNIDQTFKNFIMSSKAWKTRLQHQIEMILAHQSTQQPEGIHLPTVIEKNASDEVHPLNISYRSIVITKRNQDSLDGLFIVILIEVWRFDEGSFQIHFDIIDDLFKFGLRFFTSLS